MDIYIWRILTAAFVYFFIQTLAVAENAISIGSTTLTDLPTEVTLPINLSSDQDLSSLNLEITYDPGLLSTDVDQIIAQESRFTELGFGNIISTVDNANGVIRWIVAEFGGDTVVPAGAGELLSISFSTAKALVGETALLMFRNVSATDSAISIIPFRSTDGEIVGPTEFLGFGSFDASLLPRTIEYFINYTTKETIRSLEVEIILDSDLIKTDEIQIEPVAERLGSEADIFHAIDEESGLLKIIVTDPVNEMAILEGAGSTFKVSLTPKTDDVMCVDTRFGIISATAVSQSRDLFQPVLENVELMAGSPVAIDKSRAPKILQEGATNDAYTISLRMQPENDVTVTVEFDDQVMVTPSVLDFSPETWAEVRTVRVTAVDDNIVEGTHTSIISHRTLSNDIRFDNMFVCDTSVTIRDFVMSTEKGWNLISIPFETELGFGDTFGDDLVGKIWGWENTTQRAGLVPAARDNKFVLLSGYWLYVKGQTILEFPGESNAGIATSRRLSEGWNLYGPVVEINTPYNDHIKGFIWSWEGNVFKAVPREGGVLEPGKGYWINSKIPHIYP